MPADACAVRSQRNRLSSSSHRKTAYTKREMARNLSSVRAQFHETHAYHTCTKIDPFWLNLHLKHRLWRSNLVPAAASSFLEHVTRLWSLCNIYVKIYPFKAPTHRVQMIIEAF